MITREELNAYKKIENYSIKIVDLLNKIDNNMYRIAPNFNHIKFYDEDVSVVFDGYARGYYEESVEFPIEYLFKSLEEIESIETSKKKEREMNIKKETEEQKKREEEKERKLFEELKQKYEGGN